MEQSRIKVFVKNHSQSLQTIAIEPWWICRRVVKRIVRYQMKTRLAHILKITLARRFLSQHQDLQQQCQQMQL